ncbi:MAG: transcriptional repressor [candidate division Zixibacteria bacterium]|nr:transcriptional repressor [candidate division Zixibacteria bacterium]
MSGSDQNTEREKFSLFLQSGGLKLTSERLIIFNEALATEGHFEADDLLVILKQKGKKTSRATIYRTLEILVQAEILRKVCLNGEAVHFEKTNDQPRHDHMICRNCGKRYEFHLPELQGIQNNLCQRYNFRMQDYCFQIVGLCTDCVEITHEQRN